MVSYKENGVIRTSKHIPVKKFRAGLIEPLRWAKPIRPLNERR